MEARGRDVGRAGLGLAPLRAKFPSLFKDLKQIFHNLISRPALILYSLSPSKLPDKPNKNYYTAQTTRLAQDSAPASHFRLPLLRECPQKISNDDLSNRS